MIVPAEMLKSDRDRQFDDWGETVIFREVTQTYDPQTQQVVEAFVDTSLTAIVGEGSSKPTAGSATQHLTEKLDFLIKAEELPTTNPTSTSRVVYNTQEYDVLKFHRSIHDIVYTLECRKTA